MKHSFTTSTLGLQRAHKATTSSKANLIFLHINSKTQKTMCRKTMWQEKTHLSAKATFGKLQNG